MDNVLLAVTILSGIFFILSFIICLLSGFEVFGDKPFRTSVASGIIFTICIWKVSLALAIMAIVISCLGFTFNFIINFGDEI